MNAWIKSRCIFFFILNWLFPLVVLSTKKNSHTFFLLFLSLTPISIEKSSSIHSDVNKADQASLIRSSLTSLSTSPSATIACKLCLNDVKVDNMTKIQQCGCQFCIDVSISFGLILHSFFSFLRFALLSFR